MFAVITLEANSRTDRVSKQIIRLRPEVGRVEGSVFRLMIGHMRYALVPVMGRLRVSPRVEVGLGGEALHKVELLPIDPWRDQCGEKIAFRLRACFQHPLRQFLIFLFEAGICTAMDDPRHLRHVTLPFQTSEL